MGAAQWRHVLSAPRPASRPTGEPRIPRRRAGSCGRGHREPGRRGPLRRGRGGRHRGARPRTFPDTLITAAEQLDGVLVDSLRPSADPDAHRELELVDSVATAGARSPAARRRVAGRPPGRVGAGGRRLDRVVPPGRARRVRTDVAGRQGRGQVAWNARSRSTRTTCRPAAAMDTALAAAPLPSQHVLVVGRPGGPRSVRPRSRGWVSHGESCGLCWPADRPRRARHARCVPAPGSGQSRRQPPLSPAASPLPSASSASEDAEGPFSIRSTNPASSRIVNPSSSAFVAFEPGLSPTTT